MVERWPHMINIRDPETGDTVLDHCAGEGLRSQTEAWLAGAPYDLLSDSNGMTALRMAVDGQYTRTTRELVASLNPQLPLPRTALLTRDLAAIAERLPANLVDFIGLLEDQAHYGLFRVHHHIRFVKRRLDGFVVRGWRRTRRTVQSDPMRRSRCWLCVDLLACQPTSSRSRTRRCCVQL